VGVALLAVWRDASGGAWWTRTRARRR